MVVWKGQMKHSTKLEEMKETLMKVKKNIAIDKRRSQSQEITIDIKVT